LFQATTEFAMSLLDPGRKDSKVQAAVDALVSIS
jgi:hypothetical protein